MVWSKQEERYLKENYVNTLVSYQEMERYLEKTKKAICHKASRMCLSRGRPPKNKSRKPRKEWDNEYYAKNKDKIKENRKERIKLLKEKLIDLLGGSCSNCGYNKCTRALEFHHKQKNKESGMSVLIHDEYINKAFKEAKKCVLLCANCHRELHFGETD